MNKPEKLENEHLKYLDALSESSKEKVSITYELFQKEYDNLGIDDAWAIVNYWMWNNWNKGRKQ